MSSRRIQDLHPQFQPRARTWLNACADAGYLIVVYFTVRSAAEQHALYLQGRTPLDQVNAARATVGWVPLSAAANAHTVTRADSGSSWHEFGLALDYVPLQHGKPDWIANPRDPADIYDETEAIATQRGLVSGAAWQDYGHIEWHPGLTLERARELAAAAQPIAFSDAA